MNPDKSEGGQIQIQLSGVLKTLIFLKFSVLVTLNFTKYQFFGIKSHYCETSSSSTGDSYFSKNLKYWRPTDPSKPYPYGVCGPYWVCLLEPFLVDLMQSGFCEKTLYSCLAWVSPNLFWNFSIVVKMREQFTKSVMKFHKTYVYWPCTCISNFRVLPFAQFWSDLGKNWYAAIF